MLTLISKLEKEFDVDDVERVLAILSGTKATDRPTVSKFKPANNFAQEVKQVKPVANNNEHKPNPTQGAGK